MRRDSGDDGGGDADEGGRISGRVQAPSHRTQESNIPFGHLPSLRIINIQKHPDDIYVLTQVGDRFDLLAEQFYGDSQLWWYIAKANNMIDGTMGLDPEKRVRVPLDIEKILQSV